MIKKLFSVCINKDKVFPSLYDFCCVQIKLMDNVKCEIAKHPSELGVQIRRYFSETDDTNNRIRYPFHALPPVHFPISEQESLIKIATRSSAKIVFNQKPLPDFWIRLHSEYPALANRAVKTLMPFATTDLCESGYVRVDSRPSLA